MQLELEFECHSRPLLRPSQDNRPAQGGFVVSVRVAAGLAKVEAKHLYYALSMGELEGWKIGRIWRLWKKDVEDYAFRRSA